jgi:hypothetical protein
MILPQVHLRNGLILDSVKLIPFISKGARPYLKQSNLATTHYHLACEQHPWQNPRRDLFALGLGCELPISVIRLHTLNCYHTQGC